jgi:hypothetical protein
MDDHVYTYMDLLVGSSLSSRYFQGSIILIPSHFAQQICITRKEESKVSKICNLDGSCRESKKPDTHQNNLLSCEGNAELGFRTQER